MEIEVVMITQAVDEEHPVLGFTQGWINALAENVRKLSVLCLQAGKCSLAANVSLQVLGKGKATRLWSLRKQLQAGSTEVGPRVVFAHMCPRYAVAAGCLTGRKVPVVLWYAHSASTLWLRMAHNVSRLILTPTAESYPIPSEKVRVVGHGIDTRKFAVVSRKPTPGAIILSAGRVTRLKRYEFLIEAFSAASALLGRENVLLRILGSPCSQADERYFSQLKRTVREMGLHRAVEFRKEVPYAEIQGEYADCDIFINATMRHSIDKAPLEAMACGKIILTTNRNFRPVLDRYSPLLLADDENPRDLARKIADVVQMQSSERQRLGLALREIVLRHHSLDGLMREVAGIMAGL